jgi:hypothetical protein
MNMSFAPNHHLAPGCNGNPVPNAALVSSG